MALAMVVLPDPPSPHIIILQTSVDLFLIVRITSSTLDCNPTGNLVADKTGKLRTVLTIVSTSSASLLQVQWQLWKKSCHALPK